MPKCARPACETGLEAEYSFELDTCGEPHEEPVVIVYCAPCIALNITQGWLMKTEVSSLEKL